MTPGPPDAGTGAAAQALGAPVVTTSLADGGMGANRNAIAPVGPVPKA